MPDSPLASEIRAVVHDEFKAHGFRNRRANYFVQHLDHIAFASLQKSLYGEVFYLNIGYILAQPFPTATSTTIDRCNVRSRANCLSTPHDERYIDHLLDATHPLGDLHRTKALQHFLRSYVFPSLLGADSIATLAPLLRRTFGRNLMMDRHAQGIFGPAEGTADSGRPD